MTGAQVRHSKNMPAVLREMKATARGEYRARQQAEQKATEAEARADAAERSLRDVTRDRDQWKRRAQEMEAVIKSLMAMGGEGVRGIDQLRGLLASEKLQTNHRKET